MYATCCHLLLIIIKYHAFGLSSQVAELQLMKEQAEEAGVGVLMGYNKVSYII
jgi:hypothetical protein